ncbi:MAG: sulfur oxidation c-type cytochrome SoxX [Burkholderiales bacterium]|jgi:sulfur-oxidizing protein SoxX
MRANALALPIVVALLQCALLLISVNASAADARVDEGRRLAHDFRKGNCLACHAMPADPQAVTRTNIAPPLINMRERFADRETLYSQIWDAGQRNPNTIMPPFGKHMILKDEEIELIIDYLYTL